MEDIRSNIGKGNFSKIGKLIFIPALIIVLCSSCFAQTMDVNSKNYYENLETDSTVDPDTIAQILMDVNCENYCENIEIDPAINPGTITVCYPNSCSYGLGCLPIDYPCDYGYECCNYYCSGGVNGLCFVDSDCPGYQTGEQVCCNYVCQQSCGTGGDLGAGTCALVI